MQPRLEESIHYRLEKSIEASILDSEFRKEVLRELRKPVEVLRPLPGR